MPKPKRQATQGPFQGSTTFALAQLPTALLPTIVACLDAPARKAAALASRELHAAVAPLWSTAAFTLSDSADAPDPKPADVSWLFQRLPGLHSLRIVSDLHAFGWGLDDGMALLAAALQARPPPFRLRSFSLDSVYLTELAQHAQLPLLARADGLELPNNRRLEEEGLQPLHPFVTSAGTIAGLAEVEWRGLAAAACFTRLRCLLMDLYTPLLAGNGGAEALNAAMARLPHLHSLCLEGTYSSGWGTEVVPASNSAVLDVAAVPLLSQLTGLELRRVHLGGGVFSSLGRLTALCRLQVEPPDYLVSLPGWSVNSLYGDFSTLQPLTGLESLALGGVWWTQASAYIASLDAPAAALNLALSSLTGLTALHLHACAAGLRSKDITLKALIRLREASLEVVGPQKPVPLADTFRWIPKTPSAVRLWSLQRLALRGLEVAWGPMASLDDVLACIAQVDRRYARLLCAALPALECLELQLSMQNERWQQLEQLYRLSSAVWEDEFGSEREAGWEPPQQRLHAEAVAFEVPHGGCTARWVRRCSSAHVEIVPSPQPAPRRAEMGWYELWLSLSYTRQLG